jgi:hypothetical protein
MWTSLQTLHSVDANENIRQSDDTVERRVADLRRKYEVAIRALNDLAIPDIPHDIFLLIIDDIGPQGTSSSELGQIRYLSLKNHSQLLEMRGDCEGAFAYALKAHCIQPGDTSLLFRICKFCLNIS